MPPTHTPDDREKCPKSVDSGAYIVLRDNIYLTQFTFGSSKQRYSDIEQAHASLTEWLDLRSDNDRMFVCLCSEPYKRNEK